MALSDPDLYVRLHQHYQTLKTVSPQLALQFCTEIMSPMGQHVPPQPQQHEGHFLCATDGSCKSVDSLLSATGSGAVFTLEPSQLNHGDSLPYQIGSNIHLGPELA